MIITELEVIGLKFLSTRLDATIEALGAHVVKQDGRDTNATRVGGMVMHRLKSHGYVTKVMITGGWSITRKGRDALRSIRVDQANI